MKFLFTVGLVFAICCGYALASQKDVNAVSFGSSIKLQNVDCGFRLHSHDLRYGQGSGQQSVTGVDVAHDPNSFWVVKPAHGIPMMNQGHPVECGAVIRLEHVNTGGNLHTHRIRAGLSGQWEVSAYGFREDKGDAGDNFKVVCDGKSSGPWLRKDKIRLQHVSTKHYLAMNKRYKYSQPIQGQLEVYSTDKSSLSCYWQTAEGIYFPEND